MNVALDAIVARLMPGDQVTAAYDFDDDAGQCTVIGTIWQSPAGNIAVGHQVLRFADGQNHYGLIDLVINKPAPEPPIGSVVLDEVGDAWQRLKYDRGSYWCSMKTAVHESWERLKNIYGPLRVIYTPEVES